MIVKNLTTRVEFDDPELDIGDDPRWKYWGYDVYFFLRDFVKRGNILLVNGYFYIGTLGTIDNHDINYKGYRRCVRICNLKACELLEDQRVCNNSIERRI